MSCCAAGKEGTRKGKANMAAIARHFSFAASGPLLKKYNELKGIPTDSKPSATKSKKDDEAAGAWAGWQLLRHGSRAASAQLRSAVPTGRSLARP